MYTQIICNDFNKIMITLMTGSINFILSQSDFSVKLNVQTKEVLIHTKTWKYETVSKRNYAY